MILGVEMQMSIIILSTDRATDKVESIESFHNRHAHNAGRIVTCHSDFAELQILLRIELVIVVHSPWLPPLQPDT